MEMDLPTNVKCITVSSWLKIFGDKKTVLLLMKNLLVFLDISAQNVKELGLALIFKNKTMLS
jgi:hypothetical protein